MRLSRLGLRVAVVSVVLGVGAGESVAVANDEPTTRIAFLGGLGVNTGALGDLYHFGHVQGGEAGYQRGVIGMDWSMLFGTFYSSSDKVVEKELLLQQMALAVKLRLPIRIGSLSMSAFARGGVNMVRTSTPIPPDGKRSYYGPTAGGGLEVILFDLVTLELDGRYGLFGDGPTGYATLLSVGFVGF